MSSSIPAATLRNLLTKGQTAWAEICHTLANVDKAERQACVDYVAGHTKSWAPELRIPLYSWWEHHLQNQATPFASIVGDWSTYVWEPGAQAGERRTLPGSVGIEMIWCPLGTFLMGRPGEGDPIDEADDLIEHPQHQVTLTQGFWLSQTHITKAQYAALVEQAKDPDLTATNASKPMVQVSWMQAAHFCDALSHQLGVNSPIFDTSGMHIYDEEEGMYVIKEASLQRAYRGQNYLRADGFRLVTEAEWEYASRAGSPAPEHHLRSFEQLDPVAWFRDNATDKIHSVGSKEPNEWGLYDMLGNVGEWCFDSAYRSYENDERDPVHDAQYGCNRIVRGGDYRSSGYECNTTARSCYNADNSRQDLGFRIARSA